MLGILDTGAVYELQMTGETGGNPARGIPTTKTIKKHKLIGAQLLKKVRMEWVTTGIAKVGDVTLVSSEELTLTNHVEHEDITYIIVTQVDSKTIHGTFYSYILRRK